MGYIPPSDSSSRPEFSSEPPPAADTECFYVLQRLQDKWVTSAEAAIAQEIVKEFEARHPKPSKDPSIYPHAGSVGFLKQCIENFVSGTRTPPLDIYMAMSGDYSLP